MAKVSVIIPVYNVEAYLRQCLDSVVGQTLRDIEIICVDDGSTDASPSILAEYAAKDPRVKVLTRPRTNAGAARNAGMSLATGEYLAFVDSDDFCDSKLYEKAYARAKESLADVVFWRFCQYDERKKRDDVPYVFPDLVGSQPPVFSPLDLKSCEFSAFNPAPWNRLVRSDFVRNNGILFQEITRFNDVAFGCLVIALAQRVSVIDEVLYHYRVGITSNLQSNNDHGPELVVQAWRHLATELTLRKREASCKKAFATASANSFFYALGTIAASTSYVRFWHVLKELYEQDPFYARVTETDIVNSQSAACLRQLRSSSEPLEYLVKQSVFRREMLSRMYWAKETADKNARAAASKNDTLHEELVAAKSSMAAAKSSMEAAKSSMEAALNEKDRLLGASRADCDMKKEEIRNLKAECDRLRGFYENWQKCASTFAGRLLLKLAGKVGKGRGK